MKAQGQEAECPLSSPENTNQPEEKVAPSVSRPRASPQNRPQEPLPALRDRLQNEGFNWTPAVMHLHCR